MHIVRNVFASVPAELPRELFEDLLKTETVRVERIVSRGHASPEGFWYDQHRPEWVLLLQGRAALRLEGREAVVELGPGDYLNIPARVKHRVEWTAPETDTVWLAIWY